MLEIKLQSNDQCPSTRLVNGIIPSYTGLELKKIKEFATYQGMSERLVTLYQKGVDLINSGDAYADCQAASMEGNKTNHAQKLVDIYKRLPHIDDGFVKGHYTEGWFKRCRGSITSRDIIAALWVIQVALDHCPPESIIGWYDMSRVTMHALGSTVKFPNGSQFFSEGVLQLILGNYIVSHIRKFDFPEWIAKLKMDTKASSIEETYAEIGPNDLDTYMFFGFSGNAWCGQRGFFFKKFNALVSTQIMPIINSHFYDVYITPAMTIIKKIARDKKDPGSLSTICTATPFLNYSVFQVEHVAKTGKDKPESRYLHGSIGVLKKLYVDKRVIGVVKIFKKKDCPNQQSAEREVKYNRLLSREVILGTINGKFYVFMPWIEGMNLRDYKNHLKAYLKNNKHPLPFLYPSVVKRLQMGSNLFKQGELFHKRDLILGDPKDSNTIVTQETLELIDFDGVHILGAKGFTATYRHLPPKLISKELDKVLEEYSQADDIFIFGYMLAELFPEFFTVKIDQKTSRPATLKVKPISSDFLLLINLVKSMIADEPQHRPSMRECQHSLNELIKNLSEYFDSAAKMIVPFLDRSGSHNCLSVIDAVKALLISQGLKNTEIALGYLSNLVSQNKISEEKWNDGFENYSATLYSRINISTISFVVLEIVYCLYKQKYTGKQNFLLQPLSESKLIPEKKIQISSMHRSFSMTNKIPLLMLGIKITNFDNYKYCCWFGSGTSINLKQFFRYIKNPFYPRLKKSGWGLEISLVSHNLILNQKRTLFLAVLITLSKISPAMTNSDPYILIQSGGMFNHSRRHDFENDSLIDSKRLGFRSSSALLSMR